MTTPRITDAAREAGRLEKIAAVKGGFETGHFVQQLLDSVCAEKDKEIERLKNILKPLEILSAGDGPAFKKFLSGARKHPEYWIEAVELVEEERDTLLAENKELRSIASKLSVAIELGDRDTLFDVQTEYTAFLSTHPERL